MINILLIMMLAQHHRPLLRDSAKQSGTLLPPRESMQVFLVKPELVAHTNVVSSLSETVSTVQILVPARKKSLSGKKSGSRPRPASTAAQPVTPDLLRATDTLSGLQTIAVPSGASLNLSVSGLEHSLQKEQAAIRSTWAPNRRVAEENRAAYVDVNAEKVRRAGRDDCIAPGSVNLVTVVEWFLDKPGDGCKF